MGSGVNWGQKGLDGSPVRAPWRLEVQTFNPRPEVGGHVQNSSLLQPGRESQNPKNRPQQGRVWASKEETKPIANDNNPLPTALWIYRFIQAHLRSRSAHCQRKCVLHPLLHPLTLCSECEYLETAGMCINISEIGKANYCLASRHLELFHWLVDHEWTNVPWNSFTVM